MEIQFILLIYTKRDSLPGGRDFLPGLLLPLLQFIY